MKLNFKMWMEVGDGLPPPKQDPTKIGSGAFMVCHQGSAHKDRRNPDGELPPTKMKKKSNKK